MIRKIKILKCDFMQVRQIHEQRQPLKALCEIVTSSTIWTHFRYERGGRFLHHGRRRISGHRQKFYACLNYARDRIDLDDDDHLLGLHLYFQHGMREKSELRGGGFPRKCFGIIVSKDIFVATTLKKVRMGLMYSLAKMTTLRKVESPPWKTWGPVL